MTITYLFEILFHIIFSPLHKYFFLFSYFIRKKQTKCLKKYPNWNSPISSIKTTATKILLLKAGVMEENVNWLYKPLTFLFVHEKNLNSMIFSEKFFEKFVKFDLWKFFLVFYWSFLSKLEKFSLKSSKFPMNSLNYCLSLISNRHCSNKSSYKQQTFPKTAIKLNPFKKQQKKLSIFPD